jgi:hypothetical protein
MKKTLLIGLALGLVSLAASTSFALDQRPNAVKNGALPPQGCNGGAAWSCANQKNWGGEGIVGSSHDMTNVAASIVLGGGTMPHSGITTGASQTAINTGNGAGEDTQNRICVYCHHPHNAVIAADNFGSTNGSAPSYSPLWNRRASQARTYTGYNNGIMMSNAGTAASDKRHVLNAAEVGGGTHIRGVSLLCMSCHDGVTAMNAYSQANDDGPTGSILNSGSDTGNALNAASLTSSFEGDMNNHHPMGFNYRAVQAVDNEIAAVETIMVPATKVDIAGLLYGAGTTATMECVTCHDVHNTANQPGAERFLWRSDNNSNFCLTCHLK